jgi:hypothetical protein
MVFGIGDKLENPSIQFPLELDLEPLWVIFSKEENLPLRN